MNLSMTVAICVLALFGAMALSDYNESLVKIESIKAGLHQDCGGMQPCRWIK